MAIINILDKQTVNRIAAGEVIERPASVVKELIENAIDAGATAVTCEIAGGGIELIRITDNGSGIEADDIRNAFVRHATSKIKSADDLSAVASLGFRGEALASIAAVANVEVLTRTKGSVTGIRYRIAGGEELGLESVGCPEGTTFIIRDLFSCVPVRRKFLKTATTEGSYVGELVERIALSHPEISIKYVNNHKTCIFTTGSSELKDNIYGIYGRDITSALVKTDYNEDETGITVSGYIAKPVVARSGRNYEFYFVNGRYIRNNAISKAIEDAYAPYLMQHKFPFTVLHIAVPTEDMDVNVHPTKQEVRFEHPDIVYNAVFKAVSETLRQSLLVPKVVLEEGSKKEEQRDIKTSLGTPVPEPFEVRRRSSDVNISPTPMPAAESVQREPVKVAESPAISDVETKPAATGSSSVIAEETKPSDTFRQYTFETDVAKQSSQEITKDYSTIIHPETEHEFRKGLSDGYRIVGQVFKTYWIVERGQDMYIIDQHAAHEKIIFEQLANAEGESISESQQLSPPLIMSFSSSDCAVIEEHLEELKSLGFELESFGGREYSVIAVPLRDFGLDPQVLLSELISSLAAEHRTLPGGKSAPVVSLKDRLATCACKAAVKGNMHMTETEARALIEQLLKLDNPFNCPHGRPVIVDMTKTELEKKFKRIL